MTDWTLEPRRWDTTTLEGLVPEIGAASTAA
jgi:hypothetical protein